MRQHLLELGSLIETKTEHGISIISKNEPKRYYYEEEVPSLTLLMYNGSTIDGKDQTVSYIRKVCKARNESGFAILNLDPRVTGNPKNLKGSLFDSLNFNIISTVLENSETFVWIGWGGLVKGKTKILLPEEFRRMLESHHDRLVQIDRGKPMTWYPWHPAYLKRKRIPPEEIRLVPFDSNILKKYA
ncbi:DUF1643 domain-containing protein [Cytobacillus oceanisediminis]|uniref:DUF1643 domain-containing protein n=1 Tax=Cytobacillus oceanisediminis TaxID=665099 RepID=UPI001FB48CE5|nr:DUF1643 domain-containing protein [Cytobacillus oceanisediminis]UOE53527.1 DUF1643 domain-containing protein [Cytobacillus oceanisediminis]